MIFGAGGKTGSGGVVEATSQGKWGIGVDQDEYFTTFNGGDAPGSEFLASLGREARRPRRVQRDRRGARRHLRGRHLRPHRRQRWHHLRPVPRRRRPGRRGRQARGGPPGLADGSHQDRPRPRHGSSRSRARDGPGVRVTRSSAAASRPERRGASRSSRSGGSPRPSRASSPTRTSTSRSTRARSTACSARTAPARAP